MSIFNRQPSSEEKFNSCTLKLVEFDDYAYEQRIITVAQLYPEHILAVDPAAKKHLIGDGEDPAGTYGGSSATLHCPQTEDRKSSLKSEFNTHNGRLRAVVSLRKQAASLLCANCIYFGMTRTEASIERTEFAHAETARLEAFAALEKARQEIAAVNAPYQIEQ